MRPQTRIFSGGGPRGFSAIISLIAALGTSFVVSWMSQGRYLGLDLIFDPTTVAHEPWNLLLYPFGNLGDGRNLVSMVLTCLWLYSIGSSVEQDLGIKRTFAFWFASTLIGSLCFWVGFALVGGVRPILFGPLVPIVCFTVAWGTRAPEAIVRLMAVFPIKAKYLAWMSVAVLFFGTNNPPLAPFAALACLATWAFAAEKIPFLPYSARRKVKATTTSFRDQREFETYIDKVKTKEKERAEKERLRKLFESSIDDDPQAGAK